MQERMKPPRDWLQIGSHNSRRKSTPSAVIKSTWTLFSSLTALVENQYQKDRGGKTPMESKPGLCRSITGDFEDSLSLHFPPCDVTSTIPIELGAPNSAA